MESYQFAPPLTQEENELIRKGVKPKEYWQNLNTDLDAYFVTQPGKDLARRLLMEREREVRAWFTYSSKKEESI